MGSKIFEKILDRYIAQFVGTFSEDSCEIFKDEGIVACYSKQTC